MICVDESHQGRCRYAVRCPAIVGIVVRIVVVVVPGQEGVSYISCSKSFVSCLKKERVQAEHSFGHFHAQSWHLGNHLSICHC